MIRIRRLLAAVTVLAVLTASGCSMQTVQYSYIKESEGEAISAEESVSSKTTKSKKTTASESKGEETTVATEKSSATKAEKTKTTKNTTVTASSETSGKATTATTAMPIATRTFGSTIRISCVGDSITESGYSYWQDNMRGYLSKRFTVSGFGVSGCTAMKAGKDNDGSTKGYWRQPAYRRSKESEPDIVIIMFGTNDSKDFNWKNGVQAFKEGYCELIDTYRALPTKPLVILALPPKVFAADFAYARISNTTIEREIIPAIYEIAKMKGCRVADTHSANAGMASDFSDGVHPSSLAGAKALAEVVAAVVMESVND